MVLQSKYWCFTINNYTDSELEDVKHLFPSKLSYLIVGLERGEGQRTPHIQGYAEFKTKKRLSAVSTLLGGRAHIESRGGSAVQASEYCKKDGLFTEFGSISRCDSGRRTDLHQIQTRLNSGSSLADIAEDHFSDFIRYHKGFEKYLLLRRPSIREAPEVNVYWGATGTGKTRKVWDENNPHEVWVYPGCGWFDGYDGQEVALFDDFSGSEFKISELLKVLDRYPYKVRVKGGHVNWVPTKIILTSNLEPSLWYPNAHTEHVAALFRRFTNITHFDTL